MTVVPGPPALGVKASVGAGTVKDACAASPEMLVVTVTAYVRARAPESTVNPPVSTPADEIAHTSAVKSPTGEEANVQVVPAKPDPKIETVVPVRPEDGIKRRSIYGTTKLAELVSLGKSVVTVTA